MDNTEIWKDVPDYEGYQISNLGNVYSLKSNKMLTKQDKRGYLVVTLYKDNKKHYISVHRLVALAFIPNPYHYEQVNHKDEDKKNNVVENLEWCTSEYNINYGTRTDRARQSNIDSGHFQKLSDDLKGRGFFEERTKKLRENGTYKRLSENLRKKRSKKVVCIETGKIYDSMISASKELNICQGSISNCCNGKTKSVNGYHFRFATDEER